MNIIIPPWLITILSTVLPSLAVGICTAVITVRLSLRRFHAERWWDRKAEAYSGIVEALHSAMDYWSSRSHEETTGREIDDERGKRLSADYDNAARELRKATGIGAYIISEEVAACLEKLQKRERLAPDDFAWFEIFDNEYEAHKKALAEIRRLAKNDLKV